MHQVRRTGPIISDLFWKVCRLRASPTIRQNKSCHVSIVLKKETEMPRPTLKNYDITEYEKILATPSCRAPTQPMRLGGRPSYSQIRGNRWLATFFAKQRDSRPPTSSRWSSTERPPVVSKIYPNLALRLLLLRSPWGPRNTRND